jgi:hypothetical protein
MKVTKALGNILISFHVGFANSTDLEVTKLSDKWCGYDPARRGIIKTPDREILEAFVGHDNVIQNVR